MSPKEESGFFYLSESKAETSMSCVVSRCILQGDVFVFTHALVSGHLQVEAEIGESSSQSVGKGETIVMNAILQRLRRNW